MDQLPLPVEVSLPEVMRKPTLGAAIGLCAELAGLQPKQVEAAVHSDKGQWSRWISGGEGVVWPKLAALMDCCGNDAPLLWMAHQRRWDLHSMRRIESETERENRLLRDENAALRRVLLGRGAA